MQFNFINVFLIPIIYNVDTGEDLSNKYSKVGFLDRLFRFFIMDEIIQIDNNVIH